jgi:hypothetical protein
VGGAAADSVLAVACSAPALLVLLPSKLYYNILTWPCIPAHLRFPGSAAAAAAVQIRRAEQDRLRKMDAEHKAKEERQQFEVRAGRSHSQLHAAPRNRLGSWLVPSIWVVDAAVIAAVIVLEAGAVLEQQLGSGHGAVPCAQHGCSDSCSWCCMLPS